jgi:hypothetical protein
LREQFAIDESRQRKISVLAIMATQKKLTTYFPRAAPQYRRPSVFRFASAIRNILNGHHDPQPRPPIGFTESIYYSGEGVPPHPSLWEIWE